MRKEQLQHVLIENKKLIVVLSLLVLVPFSFLIAALFSPLKQGGQNISPTQSVYPSGISPTLFFQPTNIDQRFTVITTTPNSGEADVYPGEIIISFTTNVPITSEKGFSLSITPALKTGWKITSTFPTRIVTAQVLGGLDLNTQYTVTVKDKRGLNVYTWTFATSNQIPESSTGKAIEDEKAINAKYYPLTPYIPYYTDTYSIGYKTRLTLLIRILNKNANVEQIKKEVNQWIKSHEVDPTTHTVVFENAF